MSRASFSQDMLPEIPRARSILALSKLPLLPRRHPRREARPRNQRQCSQSSRSRRARSILAWKATTLQRLAYAARPTAYTQRVSQKPCLWCSLVTGKKSVAELVTGKKRVAELVAERGVAELGMWERCLLDEAQLQSKGGPRPQGV